MSNMFGVVIKPMFDKKVFKPGSAVLVSDYKMCTEFNAIITAVAPVFIEVLYFNAEINNGKFFRIDIDSFVEGIFEIHPLVKANLNVISNETENVTISNDNVVSSECIDVSNDIIKTVEEIDESEIEEVIVVDDANGVVSEESELEKFINKSGKSKHHKNPSKDSNKSNKGSEFNSEEDEIEDLK